MSSPPPTGPGPRLPPVHGPGDWVDQWLTPGRFARYTAASSGRADALRLYEWNAAISAAFLHDLGHLEIALRNAYDAAAMERWTGPGHWLRDDAPAVFAPLHRQKRLEAGQRPVPVDINVKPRRQVERALQAAGGPTVNTGKVVAELSFGFWRYLSTAAHEKSLWLTLLHPAFPPGTARAGVDARIGRLHLFRNRCAHSEPVIDVDLSSRHHDLHVVAKLLNPALADLLAATSGVPSLLHGRA